MKPILFIFSLLVPFFTFTTVFAQPVTLRVQTPYTEEQPTGKLLATWVDDVSVMSGGELTIELYFSSEVVPTNETFNAAMKGIIDCDATSGLYQIDKDPAFQFVGDLVGGYDTPWQQYSWLYYGDGFELAQQLYQEYNMYLVGWAVHGQESLSSLRPISGLKDLKGWKFRSPPGMATEIFTQLGAIPKVMDITETLESLKAGEIEGADAFGLANNADFKLYDIFKHANYPGFHSMPSEHLACNLEVWTKLSEQQRRIIEVAWQKYAFHAALSDEKANLEAVKKLQEEGVTIYGWTERDRMKFRETAVQTWNQWGNKNNLAREILESHKTYLRQLGHLD